MQDLDSCEFTPENVSISACAIAQRDTRLYIISSVSGEIRSARRGGGRLYFNASAAADYVARAIAEENAMFGSCTDCPTVSDVLQELSANGKYTYSDDIGISKWTIKALN